MNMHSVNHISLRKKACRSRCAAWQYQASSAVLGRPGCYRSQCMHEGLVAYRDPRPKRRVSVRGWRGLGSEFQQNVTSTTFAMKLEKFWKASTSTFYWPYINFCRTAIRPNHLAISSVWDSVICVVPRPSSSWSQTSAAKYLDSAQPGIWSHQSKMCGLTEAKCLDSLEPDI